MIIGIKPLKSGLKMVPHALFDGRKEPRVVGGAPHGHRLGPGLRGDKHRGHIFARPRHRISRKVLRAHRIFTRTETDPMPHLDVVPDNERSPRHTDQVPLYATFPARHRPVRNRYPVPRRQSRERKPILSRPRPHLRPHGQAALRVVLKVDADSETHNSSTLHTTILHSPPQKNKTARPPSAVLH